MSKIYEEIEYEEVVEKPKTEVKVYSAFDAMIAYETGACGCWSPAEKRTIERIAVQAYNIALNESLKILSEATAFNVVAMRRIEKLVKTSE